MLHFVPITYQINLDDISNKGLVVSENMHTIAEKFLSLQWSFFEDAQNKNRCVGICPSSITEDAQKDISNTFLWKNIPKKGWTYFGQVPVTYLIHSITTDTMVAVEYNDKSTLFFKTDITDTQNEPKDLVAAACIFNSSQADFKDLKSYNIKTLDKFFTDTTTGSLFGSPQNQEDLYYYSNPNYSSPNPNPNDTVIFLRSFGSKYYPSYTFPEHRGHDTHIENMFQKMCTYLMLLMHNKYEYQEINFILEGRKILPNGRRTNFKLVLITTDDMGNGNTTIRRNSLEDGSFDKIKAIKGIFETHLTRESNRFSSTSLEGVCFGESYLGDENVWALETYSVLDENTKNTKRMEKSSSHKELKALTDIKSYGIDISKLI
jgi:hypothetical protein